MYGQLDLGDDLLERTTLSVVSNNWTVWAITRIKKIL